MKLDKKIYISLIIFGALFLIFILIIIYPLFQEIKKSSQNLISEKKRFSELEMKIEELRKFEKIYQTDQENLEKIEKIFINSEAPIEFIEFLEKNSQDSQISLEISTGLPQKLKEDPWPSLNFQIALAGSFPNFLKFLEKLESSIYLVKILNLNIKRLTKSDLQLEKFKNLSQGAISANLSIKVYTK